MVKVFLSYCSIEDKGDNKDADTHTSKKTNKEVIRRNRRWRQIVMLLNAMTNE